MGLELLHALRNICTVSELEGVAPLGPREGSATSITVGSANVDVVRVEHRYIMDASACREAIKLRRDIPCTVHRVTRLG